MARPTALGVMPTPSSSLGRGGPHGRPARSMTSVRGSAPGRQIGGCAFAGRSIEALILYDNTSTVVRCQSPRAMAKTSRCRSRRTRGQSGGQRRALPSAACPCRFLGTPPARPRLTPKPKRRRTTVRFQGPGVVSCQERQHHEENPSVRRGSPEKAMRKAPSEHPARGNTRNGAHRKIVVP
jgi:hypothetical protein